MIKKKGETSRVFEIESGRDESEILVPFLKIQQNETQQVSKIYDGSIEKISQSRYGYHLNTEHLNIKHKSTI